MRFNIKLSNCSIFLFILLFFILIYFGCASYSQDMSLQSASVDKLPKKRKEQALAPETLLLNKVNKKDELWVIVKSKKDNKKLNELSFTDSNEFRVLVKDKQMNEYKSEKPLLLKHTKVNAVVSGFISYVDVTQKFFNPFKQDIEAIYRFILPKKAVVTDFVMTIGKRNIRGIILKEEEALKIYNEAKRQGYVTTMFFQDKPGLFQQQISTIKPNKEIIVKISYFNTIDYKNGDFIFEFPISSFKKNHLSGYQLDFSAEINAGIPITNVKCTDYPVKITSTDESHFKTVINLKDQSINNNIIIQYNAVKEQINSAFLVNNGKYGNYFMLLIISEECSQKVSVLSNIKIDWGLFKTWDIYPENIPDLKCNDPVVLTGRVTGAGLSEIKIIGKNKNKDKIFKLNAEINNDQNLHKGIEYLWAKNKISNLIQSLKNTSSNKKLNEIVKLSIDYGMLSPYTSFLVVDSFVKTKP